MWNFCIPQAGGMNSRPLSTKNLRTLFNLLAADSPSIRWQDANHHIIDHFLPYRYTNVMSAALKKITANLPENLLADTMRLTGKGITPTLIDGLMELQRSSKRTALRSLKGKIHFELDLHKTRR